MKNFLQAAQGEWSAMRLVTLLWVVGVLVVWVYESFKNHGLQEIPGGVTVIISFLVTGKVIQRLGELRARAHGNSSSQ